MTPGVTDWQGQPRGAARVGKRRLSWLEVERGFEDVGHVASASAPAPPAAHQTSHSGTPASNSMPLSLARADGPACIKLMRSDRSPSAGAFVGRAAMRVGPSHSRRQFGAAQRSASYRIGSVRATIGRKETDHAHRSAQRRRRRPRATRCRAGRDQEPMPRTPNERDESADSQAGTSRGAIGERADDAGGRRHRKGRAGRPTQGRAARAQSKKFGA